MKKQILLSLLIAFISVPCFAQVGFTVQGGTSLTGLTGDTDYNARMGYRFGVGIQFPLFKNWKLQTGLQVLNRSYSFDGVGSRTYMGTTGMKTITKTVKSKINGIYLLLPVQMVTYLPLNKNCGWQFSAGPYIANGIGGVSTGYVKTVIMPEIPSDGATYPLVDDSSLTKDKQKTFGAHGGLESLDIGVGIGVDFKYQSLFVGIGAEYGFLPVSKEFPKDALGFEMKAYGNKVSPHNIGLEIHIGFCFDASAR